MELIRLENVRKTFGKGESRVTALDGVSLSVEKGELIGIIGKSGSGKSTLLNIMGSLMCLDEGEYYYQGTRMDFSKGKIANEFRKKEVGFVLQYFGLIPDRNVYQNVALPLKYQNIKRVEIKKMVEEVLKELGIEDKIKAFPDQLSGGQRQRVAIARALVKNAEIILADEPTGALDEKNGNSVMELLKAVNKKGKTVIIVTHDSKIANQCDRIIELRDGKIV